MSEPVFFKSQAEWRRWLAQNHDSVKEIRVGLVKVGSGLAGVTHRQALDEALCFGWIDGIRKGIDAVSYRNRLTPRRKGSNWSAINIARVAELEAAGRMRPAGRRAFEMRDPIARVTTRSRTEESS